MDDPATLRKKAARYFNRAASSPTTNEAEKLNEVGCQLEVWADELEKSETRRPERIEADEGTRALNHLNPALWKESVVFGPDGSVALARGRF
jgi:hypothetical protein